MKEKMLLIDGHSILHRAFYGLPPLSTGEGIYTNAVYGFLTIMLKVMQEERPQYLAVAFDLHAPTFRHKMFEEYKGTRKPMPEEMRPQVPLMKEVLRSMRIPIFEKEGFEADDILGTLGRKGEEAGMDVTILSGDRDLLQLATEAVRIRIPKTTRGATVIEDYYAGDVVEKYEVTPEEFIDLKALMGDASDNIPGIPGVGIKTATRIIARYHSIEEAYANVEKIKPKKAMESLRDHYDQAELSKKLATIDTDAPVAFDPEEMKTGDMFNGDAYQMFKKLEFRNLLGYFDKDMQTGADLPKIRVIQDFGQIDEVFKRAERSEKIGLSLTGLPAVREKNSIPGSFGTGPKIRGVSLALSKEETYFIFTDGFVAPLFLKASVERVFERAGKIITYDLKDILQYLDVEERGNVFDIKIAAYLLDPLRSDYPYDRIAAEYGKVELPAAEEIFEGKKIPAAEKMTKEQTADYYGYMSLAAYLSEEALSAAMTEMEMRSLFDEIEMPLVYTLSGMEKEGMKVHGDELIEFGKELQVGIDRLTDKIYEAAGEEFNLNSPKQLGEILFEKMHLPGGKKTKTGYSTAAAVLEKLAVDVPFVSDILEYRQLAKLKSTYADSLAGFVQADGRIHTSFNQTITATGRISSTEPNLQNIPVRMEMGRKIRRVFVPEEGCVYIDADYSQIELRVLAHMSGDQKLISAYKQAQDIHTITASQVFHVPLDEVTPLQRRNAKAVNFGIVYGISSFGLSQGLSISRKEASEYIERYFETYPGIKKYLDRLVEDAKKNGYASTMYGRRRPIPELASGNFTQRSFGERVAMNSPIQGTAADIIKIAMNRVAARLKKEELKAKLILQVHDELLIEAPKEEAARVCVLLSEEMQNAAKMDVDLVVDMHQGLSWYDAK
ncbi:MAG TPA: DNA polymerase I [Lachnospiraceae bacterium]|nr:DNA polymerase I [Lachnospiraceae bacterium]